MSCLGCACFLFSLSYAVTYEQALFRMTVAIGFIGFHSGAVMVNPQDIAPQFAGSVFGECHCYRRASTQIIYIKYK